MMIRGGRRFGGIKVRGVSFLSTVLLGIGFYWHGCCYEECLLRWICRRFLVRIYEPLDVSLPGGRAIRIVSSHLFANSLLPID